MRSVRRNLFTLAGALAAVWAVSGAAACARSSDAVAATPAASPTSSSGAATAPIQLPVGDVELDVDTPQIDEKLGGAFVLGLRSGANNCYTEALGTSPRQEGEIAFVVKPPAGEGRYLVTVERKGTLSETLVACVRSVFDDFYHYQDKEAFGEIPGTLRFTPHLVPAPPLPTEAARRAILDAQYAAMKVVRVDRAVQTAASLDSASSTEVFQRYAYALDLVFVTDGYESVCTHYEPYKVFTARPYRTPYAGHVCETRTHKAGDHVADAARLLFALELWPTVGTQWELHGGGVNSTLPAE